jgi:L-fuculose-phosphate aldolase
MAKRAYEQRLITGTEGTFSSRIDDNSFLITPCDQDRLHMSPEDLILIRNGKREKGTNPSRSVELHMRVYAEHPEINSIIIAHPTNTMAFSISGTEFDTRTIPECYMVLKKISVFPYGPQHHDASALSAALQPEAPMIIIDNDCLISTGSSLLQAYDRLEVAEFSAKAIISALPAGEIQPISGERLSELEENFVM